MKFIITTKINSRNGPLIYRRNEYSFDTLQYCDSGITSILINELQLEIDLDGNILYVWGLCPIANYTETSITPKNVQTHGIKAIFNKEIVAGVSIKLNEIKRWPIYFHRDHGWICVGEPKVENVKMVQFSPGCIALSKVKC